MSTAHSPFPGYLRCEQAAARLRLSEHTIRVYMTRGLINGVKIGTTWLIPVTEVSRYKQERRRPGRPSDR